MLLLSALLCILLSICVEGGAFKVSYHNHQVIRCVPENEAHINKFRELPWEYWQEPRKVGVPVDILTTIETRAEMDEILEMNRIPCRVLIKDVQDVIDVEAKYVAEADVSFLENYHEWTDVHQYFEVLAANFSNLASVSTIGKTYLGKDIKIITLSTNPTAKKPTLFFDGGLHAREWITVATVTYMADSMLRTYGTDAGTTFLLDNFDVIICPMINVDGYEYTWTTDRMWRKTRSPNAKSVCDGTDPNRNWAFHWGEAGANNIACSDSYQGPSPASEPEVVTVQDFICKNNATIKGYVNFHSYSQTWMSNWGYTAELPADYKQQNELSAAVVEAIKGVHGVQFDYGPIATTIYPASGSSADYTYGVCGVKYSYGAELRDQGEYGFLLPADQITPSGEEILAGMVAMARYISKNP